jgi:hypothetical protein
LAERLEEAANKNKRNDEISIDISARFDEIIDKYNSKPIPYEIENMRNSIFRGEVDLGYILRPLRPLKTPSDVLVVSFPEVRASQH